MHKILFVLNVFVFFNVIPAAKDAPSKKKEEIIEFLLNNVYKKTCKLDAQRKILQDLLEKLPEKELNEKFQKAQKGSSKQIVKK